MEFKDKLKLLRLNRNISQEQLSKAINYSLSTITKWELGTREPNFHALKALCDFFNVSADYLLGTNEYTDKVTSSCTQTLESCKKEI